MRIGIRALTLAALLLLTGSAHAGTPLFTGWTLEDVSSRPLAEGLTLWEYRLSAPDAGILPRGQRLHVLEMEIRQNPQLVPRVASHGSIIRTKGKLSGTMAELAMKEDGLKVLAGINGDFFDTSAGGSLGLTLSQGRLVMSGEFPQGWSLGFTASGEARIGRPRLQMSFSASRKGKTIIENQAIDALNCLRGDIALFRSNPLNAYQARLDNHLVLYTNDWYRATMAGDGGYEVALEVDGALSSRGELRGTVKKIHRVSMVTKAGSEDIPQGMALDAHTMVLSATGEAASLLQGLKRGDEITLRTDISEDWADIVTCLGGGRPDGGPLLIKDGVIQPEMTGVDDYIYFYAPHPRTAVGLRRDGSVFFLCCDGYSLGKANGLTIAQLSQVMLDLGAYTALNLDGGPSTTMAVAQGDVYQVLGGAEGIRLRETPVGNCLIFCQSR